MTSNQSPPSHFYTLDSIRGIAAIIVILNHWEFFYYANDTWVHNGFDKTALPFYPYLSAIYNNGVAAVDMFFLLSGFIFFWLYAERIAKRKINFRKFIVFRISRLYPIHLVTLLSVAGLQWLMFKNTGHYFIILYNDSYHFILNLLFMQNWGFEKGASFNGPSWSASVEVFLYFIFFIICYLKLQNKKWLLFLLIPVGVFLQYYYTLIGKGMYSFFLGALVYYLYVWMLKENRVKKYLPALITFTVLLWVLMFAEYQLSYIRDIWMKQYPHIFHNSHPESALKVFDLGKNFVFRTFVSPSTILSLALWETNKGMLNKKWALLGNCSYAMYLIHFSLQITFVLIADAFHINRLAFHSPISLLIFFLILLPLSIGAYNYFELPAQQKLRDRFGKTKSSDAGIAEVKVPT
ncbi:acyltransferase family protein [Mucilaginibacter sp. RCC_168]|uniref:acyltransferase family protein n=1 Tax=Mucilaginibacter sp. RCC_168 TaxID=3239221 RepID=UPI0035262BD4